MHKLIKTTCPYCGVGCGIEAEVNQQSGLLIQGDKQHPANFGRLCSKGAALADTVELTGRLMQPKILGKDCEWDEALDKVAETLSGIIEEFGPEAVAFYGSGQLLTEDYYVANKLMKGFIGGGNMDTNSRLCMSSTVAGHKRAFGSDTVPGCYEDFEHAELIVLIGSNAAWCHPVIFQRIRAAKTANPALKIVVIDPRKTNSCDIADLHLAIAPGTDAHLFNGLLQYLQQQDAIAKDYIASFTEGFSDALAAASQSSATISQLAEQCRLTEQDLALFFAWFAESEKVMSLFSQGINQSSSGTDKVNAIINCHLATGKIGQPGMGPFSLTGQPNAMGGREVGGLANQLAAHMDFSNSADIERVARFWGSTRIAQKPGYAAVELFDAVYDGKVKAIWIMGTNPVVSLPNADIVKQALERCDFVVVSDCIAQTDTSAFAHVLLPAQGWSEKDGTVTNSERRISRQRALLNAAGMAKPDWWIISQIAQRMGFAKAFAYQSVADIFREHAALSGFENDLEHGVRDFDISGLANISQTDYDKLQPIQWPVNQDYPDGRKRLFDKPTFFTASGKAQFIAITPRTPVNLPDQAYPLTLNTGRIRDQWHTMTRTALAAKLNQHKPEPFVEIHPEDASRLGLLPESLARIQSRWGSMLARVHITESQQIGSLFIPMHWTSQLAAHGRVGALVNPVVDPISKQPEAKQTPVSISAYSPLWYGFVLTRAELAFDDIDYWVKVKGENCYRYELAGETLPEHWPIWAKEKLDDASCPKLEWQEYEDATQGIYRAASFQEQQLQSILLVSRQYVLPERGWLSRLFAKPTIDKFERISLLSGEPPIGSAEVGAIVCACFNVDDKSIKTAIKEKCLKTYQEVGACLKAGTNCGSCIPEIKALLSITSVSERSVI